MNTANSVPAKNSGSAPPPAARDIPRGAVIGPAERLRVTVLFSLLLHAVIVLGVGFTYEEPAASLPSLDIILVPAQTEDKPEKPDFLANASQKGGGESDEAKRPKQPTTSPVPKPDPGIAPVPMRASAPKPSPKTPERVIIGADPALTVQKSEEKQEVPKLPQLTGRELMERSLEMARLAAEVERQTELYAKRPKRKFISANTQEYAYAAYMRAWVARVERIGNLNYPDEARRKNVNGQLVMTVAVKRDGTIDRIDVIQPSGYPMLDDSAQQIVRLAEPFAPLPKTDENIDVLHITRTWQFLPGGILRNE